MTSFRNGLVVFILTLGLSAVARAQEMSAQQRDFAALYRQCADRIRGIDAEPARQAAREGCQGQMRELIGSKLDNWVGRVTSVRIEPHRSNWRWHPSLERRSRS